MVKPTGYNTTKLPALQDPWINTLNFYNVDEDTDPSILLTDQAWTKLNPPSYMVTRNLVIPTSASGFTSNFRTGYTRLATVTYDRYRRSATVTWHATEYTGGIVVPFGSSRYVDGGPKP